MWISAERRQVWNVAMVIFRSCRLGPSDIMIDWLIDLHVFRKQLSPIDLSAYKEVNRTQKLELLLILSKILSISITIDCDGHINRTLFGMTLGKASQVHRLDYSVNSPWTWHVNARESHILQICTDWLEFLQQNNTRLLELLTRKTRTMIIMNANRRTPWCRNLLVMTGDWLKTWRCASPAKMSSARRFACEF